jgi:uncharacterized membrane protein YsdA (DUF1294 family)
MIQSALFILCVLVIIISVIGFSISYWNDKSYAIRWLMAIPAVGVLYLVILFTSFLIGW